MTKSDLIKSISEKVENFSPRDVEVIVNNIFDSMSESLMKGEKIEIRGFGSFKIKHRSARKGRNPKTGELVDVPSKNVPFFKVGKELREMLNKG